MLNKQGFLTKFSRLPQCGEGCSKTIPFWVSPSGFIPARKTTCFTMLWSLLCQICNKVRSGYWGLHHAWRWFLLRFRMVLSHTQTTPKKKPNFFRSITWPDPGLAIMYHAASPCRFESITNQSKIQVNVGYSYREF